MDEHDVLAERFEAHRPRLRAVAYQMLGSTSDADDAVQEAWLRLSRSDPDDIENLGGWLTPIVARSPAAARQLASRARRRVQGVDQVLDTDLNRQRAIVDAFLAAARNGDFDSLLEALDPDVVVRSNGAEAVRGAAAVAGRAL